jgi:hypothetical protein
MSEVTVHTEENKVEGDALIHKFKALVHEGNMRRTTIKK